METNANATITSLSLPSALLTVLLCRYLGEVRVLTTSCCITELERLGPALYGALTVAKSFPVYKCGHKVAVPASQCVGELAAGKAAGGEHFIVASQDPGLRSGLSIHVLQFNYRDAVPRFFHITHHHPP